MDDKLRYLNACELTTATLGFVIFLPTKEKVLAYEIIRRGRRNRGVSHRMHKLPEIVPSSP